MTARETQAAIRDAAGRLRDRLGRLELGLADGAFEHRFNDLPDPIRAWLLRDARSIVLGKRDQAVAEWTKICADADAVLGEMVSLPGDRLAAPIDELTS